MRKQIPKMVALLGSALFAVTLVQGGQHLNTHALSNSPAAAANTGYDLIELTGPEGQGWSNLAAADITNSGIVSGYYSPQGYTNVHTFFFENGVYTDLTEPGATHTSMVVTNNGRQYGNWGSSTEQVAGFRDQKTGQWTALPNYGSYLMNFIWRMNEAGLSVGDSCEGIWGNIGYCVGWKWDKELAAYQAPVHPKAVLTGINNRKQIVGLLYSSDGIPQAYLEYKGQFTLLSDRSSVAWDINDAGEVLITFMDTLENALLDGKGIHVLPNPDQSAVTMYQGINDRGDLVGYWIDSSGNSHAFMAIRKHK